MKLNKVHVGIILGLIFANIPDNNKSRTIFRKITPESIRISIWRINRIIKDRYLVDVDLNDKLSKKILLKFLYDLDFTRDIQIFKKSDIDEFKTNYETIIDNKIKDNTINFAYDIFERFKVRTKEREEQINEIVDNFQDNFDSDDYYIIQKNRFEIFSEYDDWVNKYWLEEGKRKDKLTKKIKYEYLKKLSDDEKDIKESIKSKYKRIWNYYEKFDEYDIFDLAISSYLYYLDPHSSYFTPNEYQNFITKIKGFYYGIGAELTSVNGETIVTNIFIGGPAYKSGKFKKDDVIFSIIEKGKETKFFGMSLSDVVSYIKGPENTTIVLKVIHKEDGSKEKITLTRGKIDISSDGYDKQWNSIPNTNKITIVKIPSNKNEYIKIGVIKFNSFLSGGLTEKFIKKRIEILKDSVSGIIIDLRGNGGGSLRSVINIADMFIDTGLALKTKYKDKMNQEEENMVVKGKMYDKPISVLVNSNSASASEILAGIIQYYNRGLIIGTSKRTFGKGLVQKLLPLRNPKFEENAIKDAIKLTTSSYHLPSGKSPQFTGIKPDIELYQNYYSLLSEIYGIGYEKYFHNVITDTIIGTTDEEKDIKLDDSLKNKKEIEKYVKTSEKFKFVEKYQQLINEKLNIQKKFNEINKIPLNKKKYNEEYKINIMNLNKELEEKDKELEDFIHNELEDKVEFIMDDGKEDGSIYPSEHYSATHLGLYLSALITNQIKHN